MDHAIKEIARRVHDLERCGQPPALLVNVVLCIDDEAAIA